MSRRTCPRVAAFLVLAAIASTGLAMDLERTVLLPDPLGGVVNAHTIATDNVSRVYVGSLGGVQPASARLACYTDQLQHVSSAALPGRSLALAYAGGIQQVCELRCWCDGNDPQRLVFYDQNLGQIQAMPLGPGGLYAPAKIVLWPGGVKLYCTYTNAVGTHLAIVNMATPHQLVTDYLLSPDPIGSDAMVSAGGYVFVGCGATLYRIDWNNQMAQVSIGSPINAVAYDMAEDLVCVATSGNKSVTVVNGSTLIIHTVVGPFASDVGCLAAPTLEPEGQVYAGLVDNTNGPCVQSFYPVTGQLYYSFNWTPGTSDMTVDDARGLIWMSSASNVQKCNQVGYININSHTNDSVLFNDRPGMAIQKVALVATTNTGRIMALSYPTDGIWVGGDQLARIECTYPNPPTPGLVVCMGGRVSHLAYNPWANKPTALCYESSYGADVDPATGVPVDGFYAGIEPKRLAFNLNHQHQEFYVSQDGKVDVRDANGNQRTDQIGPPGFGNVNQMLWKPSCQAQDPDKLYVPKNDENYLHIYNASNHSLLASVFLPKCTEVSPLAHNANPTQDKVYCGSSTNQSHELYIVDGHTNMPGTHPVVTFPNQHMPKYMVWNQQNGDLYVATYDAAFDVGAGGVYVVDGVSDQIIAAITDDHFRPLGIAYSQRHNEVYVLGRSPSRLVLWIINCITNQRVAIMDEGPWADHTNHELLYVPETDRCYVCTGNDFTGELRAVDCRTWQVAEVHPFQTPLYGLAFDPLGSYLMVGEKDECAVYVLKEHELAELHSTSPEATFPSSGRHLTRDAMTGELHAVYSDGVNVIYAHSTDDGDRWQTENLGPGQWPTIELDFNRKPWVVFRSGNDIVARMKTGTTGWQPRTVYHSDDNYLGQPSLVMSNLLDDHVPWPLCDLGYVVFTESLPSVTHPRSILWIAAFDQNGVYGPPPKNCVMLDDALQQDYVLFGGPCIARTPGDSLHVVWERNVRPERNASSVWYRESHGLAPWVVKGRGLLPTDFKAAARITPDPAEASYGSPFIEAWGDSVYASVVYFDYYPWACQVQGKAHKVGQDPSLWSQFSYISPADIWVDGPTASTKYLTEWQQNLDQQNNYEVLGKWTDNQSFDFSNSFNSSKYEHCDVELAAPGPIAEDHIRTIWTEEELAGRLYEVKYRMLPHLQSDGPGDERNVYYAAGLGDSIPWQFCLRRDGRKSVANRQFDFAEGGLRYLLPFLDPMSGYRLRILACHDRAGKWTEDVLLDDSLCGTVSFDSSRLDTAWIDIPNKLYEKDARVTLRLRSGLGRYAAAARLSLFQIPPRIEGEGQLGSQFALPLRPELMPCSPNPFVGGTKVTFSLPCAGNISLAVYDVSGRLVRPLLSGPNSQGRHSAYWDGATADGRQVGAGVYFVKLRTDGEDLTRKVVLTRE